MNLEAVRIGRSHGLGEPLGVWRREVKRPRGVWWVFGPVLAVLMALVMGLLGGVAAVVPVLVMASIFAGLYVLALVLNPRPRADHWLYAYTGGLVEVYPRWPARVVRWDEVVDVVDSWASAGPEAPLVWSYEGWLLTLADGTTMLVAAAYQNSELIHERVVAPVVARRVEAIRGGAVVAYGDLRVQRDGIAGGKDTTVTPWSAVERVELRSRRVRVRLAGGKTRRYNDGRDPSGHAVLRRVLTALGVSAT